ncbi:MAG: cobalt-precorrin-5B (C(1))-methyltransferase [Gemmatimonas sp.]
MRSAEARPLRRGYTTGACATAASAAAFEALLTGRFPDPVTIRLPNGQPVSFALAHHAINGACAEAGVIKDAGDDPDVTHGATVLARVERGASGAGVVFRAGPGVGTVTRAGLPLAVGEPAINPVPRRMIGAALGEIAGRHRTAADAIVTLSIPGGDDIAKRTANPRLGIVGGLSILGTTGIVIPYSCASWIHSIHRGIDVARANGIDRIIAATGRTSEAAAQKIYDAPEIALIDMGDFAGGMLKYLRAHPVRELVIAGGFGKLAKLAQGELDLHSSRSRLDVRALACTARDVGAPEAIVAAIESSSSAGEALVIATNAGLARGLIDAVADRARGTALATLAGGTSVDVLVFDRAGTLIGRSGP